MLARCARATRRTHTHHTRVEMHLVECVWEHGVLFFGQVGAWSTTLPRHLSNVPDVASGRMHDGEMCTCHTSHAHSPHTSRDAPCGVWRVVFWPSWCLVHHTTMSPFKRARRGEWAYACWRDVHVSRRTHTHHTRVEMHLVACVWEYGVLFFGQVGAGSTTLP